MAALLEYVIYFLQHEKWYMSLLSLAICGRFSAHLFQKFKDRIEILDGPLNKTKNHSFHSRYVIEYSGSKNTLFQNYTISESILFEDQLYIVYAKMRNDFFKNPNL